MELMKGDVKHLIKCTYPNAQYKGYAGSGTDDNWEFPCKAGYTKWHKLLDLYTDGQFNYDRIVRKTTAAVACLLEDHDLCYLDLKPGNVAYGDDHFQDVKLIDLDSIVPLGEHGPSTYPGLTDWAFYTNTRFTAATASNCTASANAVYWQIAVFTLKVCFKLPLTQFTYISQAMNMGVDNVNRLLGMARKLVTRLEGNTTLPLHNLMSMFEEFTTTKDWRIRVSTKPPFLLSDFWKEKELPPELAYTGIPDLPPSPPPPPLPDLPQSPKW